jgi:hydrogenase maturation protease
VSGPVVVGVGNDWRGDDAAGLVVARRLREAGIPTVEVGGDPAALLDAWAGASHAIGLAEAVALARTLGRVPARLEIYGIEAGEAEIAAGLTPAVACAVAALGRELRERLAGAAPPR